jgi:polygalacturonase
MLERFRTLVLAALRLSPGVHGADLDVKAFGAKGDGKTPDTAGINKAIEAAAAAGGGTVHFPRGRTSPARFA